MGIRGPCVFVLLPLSTAPDILEPLTPGHRYRRNDASGRIELPLRGDSIKTWTPLLSFYQLKVSTGTLSLSSRSRHASSIFSMLASTLFCQVLLAVAAVAAPSSKERLAQRVARRAAGLQHQSSPKQVSSSGLTSEFTNSTQAEFSSNWSGAVLVSGAVRVTSFGAL